MNELDFPKITFPPVYPIRLRAAARALALPLALLATGCAGDRVEVPLFDPLHPPLVLTESSELAGPGADKDRLNRFLAGWRDVRRSRRHAVALKAVSGARLQAVQLLSRPRRLVLEAARVPEASGDVALRFDDGAWMEIPIAAEMVVAVPEDVGPGRFKVDIRPGEAGLVLRSAKLSPAFDPGRVEIHAGNLTQAGYSMAEVVRRLDGRARLSGTLRPPGRSQPGQRFAVEVETSASNRQEVFAWSSTDPGTTDFDVRLPDEEFVRIRLVADGTGDPGQWRDLTIRARRPDTPPPATVPATSPRLVVLYIMDALRADHVGHLGGRPGITPTIDRLASEGATFVNHFSVAPNTVPSTKSVLTGNKYLRKGGTRLTADSGPTLAERYVDAGFATGLFSGNGNVGAWLRMGRGYQSDAGKVLWRSNQGRNRAGYNNSAEVLHDETLAWLDQLEPGASAFLHLQTINPHNPYDPPEPFRSRFAPDNESQIDGKTRTLKDIHHHNRKVTRDDKERLRGLYAASVAYNDAHLEDFVDGLLQRYKAQEILFILTSDHGEELFDHGGVLHGYTLYDEMLRIPLVVWWPGVIEPDTVIEGLTDNVDLHAALAALVTDPESMADGGGESLWPYLTGEHDPRQGKDVVFAAAASLKGGLFMARSQRYKVVRAPRGGRHWGMGQGLGRGFDADSTFDLTEDPGEMHNRAGEPLPEADWLRQQLDAWVEIGSQLERGEVVDDMDDATRESLEALGYL